MGFQIVPIRPHVVIVHLSGALTQSDWDAYERDFRAMYKSKQRLIMVYDMRGMDVANVGSLLPLVLQKKDMLVAFKAHTCRKLFAAIVITPHEIITNIVTNILRLSGQVSLFYAFTTVEETVRAVDSLSRVLLGQTPMHPPAPHQLCWRDVPTGHLYALLLYMFLRRMRVFLMHDRTLVDIDP